MSPVGEYSGPMSWDFYYNNVTRAGQKQHCQSLESVFYLCYIIQQEPTVQFNHLCFPDKEIQLRGVK